MSQREAEVLQAVGGHLTNAQIASRLHISVRTVESHVSSLLRKFGVSDRRELAGLAPAVAARPPAGPGGGPVTGLAAARTSFIGRDTEQAMVIDALAGSRVVTLVGPGGVGKTRLAAKTAELVAGTYPCGAIFVDLVPVREGFATQAVATLLGVTERPGRSLDAALHEYLARGRSLLVLDNCEHLLGVVAEFTEKLLANCDGLTILTTSRERLAIAGERTVTVPPLSLISDEASGTGGSEAVALFTDRVRASDPGFTAAPKVVGEVCARLDGVPLAIELAAARCASLGADGLLAGLDDHLRLLSGSRGVQERHRSLRSVIDWSHDLLDEPERALFRRAGAFVGGFDLDAAVAVFAGFEDFAGFTGGGRGVVADLVGRLTDKSLLVHRHGPGGSRWQMLETIRAYALDRLAASGEEATVRAAHLRWATSIAEDLERRAEAEQAWMGYAGTRQPAQSRTAQAGHAETGRAGAAQTGTDQTGQAGWTGAGQTGTDLTGQARAGQTRAGQTGWTGAGQAGTDLTGQARAGQTGTDHAETDLPWRTVFDMVADDLRSALVNAPAPADTSLTSGNVSHRLARALGHLAYARRFMVESREHYEAAAARAGRPAQAASDLRTAADVARAAGHVALAFDLLLASANRAEEGADDSARAIALAYAAMIADRFAEDFPVEVPQEQLRQLLDEAARICPAGDTVAAAYLTAAAAWTAHPEKTVPDPVLSHEALAAARRVGDPVLISGALDAVVVGLDSGGRIREAHQVNKERAKLLDRLPRHDPRAGAEIVDIFHMVTAIAVTAGDLPDALSSARMAQRDDIAGGQPHFAASKLILPLVLQGRFDETFDQACAMWEAWQRAGRPPARWMGPATYGVALAHGLRGDHDGYHEWLGHVYELIGNGAELVSGTNLAAAAAFTQARICLHDGRVDEAVAAIADLRPEVQNWYDVPRWHSLRPYAWAIAAEVAVAAGLPDAANRLTAAAPAGEENYWAAACLARAAGRLHGDRGALEQSLAGWERIGARFERACTLVLLGDRAAEGYTELKALGCPPPTNPI